MKAMPFVRFWIDGFRQMEVGRLLWLIVLLKLAVLFLVLKLFFFPDYWSLRGVEGQIPETVSDELIERTSSYKPVKEPSSGSPR